MNPHSQMTNHRSSQEVIFLCTFLRHIHKETLMELCNAVLVTAKPWLTPLQILPVTETVYGEIKALGVVGTTTSTVVILISPFRSAPRSTLIWDTRGPRHTSHKRTQNKLHSLNIICLHWFYRFSVLTYHRESGNCSTDCFPNATLKEVKLCQNCCEEEK